MKSKDMKVRFLVVLIILLVSGSLVFAQSHIGSSTLQGTGHNATVQQQSVDDAGASTQTVEGAVRYVVDPRFKWEMSPRFIDRNGNQIPDLPNSFEFVHNLSSGTCATVDCSNVIPKFDVIFDASTSLGIHVGSSSHQNPPTYRRFYRWQISAPDGTTQAESAFRASPTFSINLPEGVYDVSLTVVLAQSTTAAGNPMGVLAQNTTKHRIPVEDMLIVSIGDSFSSGEGNPERPRGSFAITNQVQWAEDGSGNNNSVTNMKHAKAHRSTLAWPAQAALSIENADEHSSVTFISVATTGAAIQRGLLAPSRGSKHEPTPPGGLPAQLDEIKTLIGDRQIDLLLISIGVNDAGFANILTGFLASNESEGDGRKAGATTDFLGLRPWEQRLAVVSASQTGDWSNVLEPAPLEDRCGSCPFPTGTNSLYSNLMLLDDELRDRFPDKIADVYMLGYPDPTQARVGDNVEQCLEILYDLVGPSRAGPVGHIVGPVIAEIAGESAPDLEIGRKEQRDLVNLILEPVNNTIKNAAEDKGWVFVPTAPQFANGHGYCAPPPMFRPDDAYWFVLGNPYPDPVPPSDENSSWFRKASGSRVAQGPLGVGGLCGFYCVGLALETYGTMHPNELGHQAAKQLLLSQMILPVDIPGMWLKDTDNSLSEARTYLPPNPIQDDIKPASDVDVFSVNVSTLALSAPPMLPTENAQQPGQVLLTIEVKVYGGWESRVRLFDSTGGLLQESTQQQPSRAYATFPLNNPSDGVYYIAVSSNQKKTFDIITGAGKGGGRGGQYSLTIKKVWKELRPTLIPKSTP